LFQELQGDFRRCGAPPHMANLRLKRMPVTARSRQAALARQSAHWPCSSITAPDGRKPDALPQPSSCAVTTGSVNSSTEPHPSQIANPVMP